MIIATHNGSFHADDVFGVAVLRAVLSAEGVTTQLIRTRDPELLQTADFAVDVSGEWDPSRGRFDHHQKGFDGKRPSGVVYASSGLVWKEFGVRFVSSRLHGAQPDLGLATKVAEAIDEELVQYLDMVDTGARQVAPGWVGLSALLHAFNLPGSKESGDAQAEVLERFVMAADVTVELLNNIIAHKEDELLSAQAVREAPVQADGRILVLPRSGLAWIPVVVQEMPLVEFVVYPDSSDEQFQVRTVPNELGSFIARKDLPKEWAGLRDGALAAVTGVTDAVFCHNGRFIGGARSLDGALAMAQLALIAHEPKVYISRHVRAGEGYLLACDGNCTKAWGVRNRPWVQLGKEDDDIGFLSDSELGDAPVGEEPSEGGDTKPYSPLAKNKWCARQCERSVIAATEDTVQLPDFSKRVLNQPWKHQPKD